MLLANDKYDDLSRMYRLFSRVENGLVPMAKIVQGHIEKMGNEIINQREARIEKEGEKDSNQDPNFVRSLLDLHDKFMAVVNAQFEKNSLFHKALKEAFVEFVNRDVGKFKNADLMSSFCDRILKKGGDKLSDEEVEDSLEKVRASATDHTHNSTIICEVLVLTFGLNWMRCRLAGCEPVHVPDGQGPVRRDLPQPAGQATTQPAVVER